MTSESRNMLLGPQGLPESDGAIGSVEPDEPDEPDEPVETDNGLPGGTRWAVFACFLDVLAAPWGVVDRFLVACTTGAAGAGAGADGGTTGIAGGSSVSTHISVSSSES